MKSVFVTALLVLVSTSAFAGAGGEIVTCVDKSEKLEVSISKGAVDEGGSVKGFKEQGANKDLGGRYLTTSILRADQQGAVTAVLTTAKGSIIQILATGLKDEYCSGCTDGVRHRYTSATVMTDGDYEYVQKSGFSCELEVE